MAGERETYSAGGGRGEQVALSVHKTLNLSASQPAIIVALCFFYYYYFTCFESRRVIEDERPSRKYKARGLGVGHTEGRDHPT